MGMSNTQMIELMFMVISVQIIGFFAITVAQNNLMHGIAVLGVTGAFVFLIAIKHYYSKKNIGEFYENN